jgi:phosphoribosylglycinamide formyltransferase-1
VSGGPSPAKAFRLAVLASGNGSNLQAIIDQLHRPEVVMIEITDELADEIFARGTSALPRMGAAPASAVARQDEGHEEAGGEAPRIEVVLVVSDVPEAYALTRARLAGIRAEVLSPRDFASREEHDLALTALLCEAEPDLVVLAGYMRLVAPTVLQAFPNRIINLHPALLPSFPGTAAIADALRYGVKVTGVTVHFVDEGVDTGPIIAQEAVRVEEDDTEETLAARIHAVEHRLLPHTIRLIAAGRVKPPLPGSRVVRVD